MQYSGFCLLPSSEAVLQQGCLSADLPKEEVPKQEMNDCFLVYSLQVRKEREIYRQQNHAVAERSKLEKRES